MMTTIRVALAEGAAVLRAASVPEERMQAASLLMHVLNMQRATLIAHPEQELTDEQTNRFRQLIDRRAAREPLQYIIGRQEFFSLDFEVTPDVLIPRPETELVVETALEIADRGKPFSILDVGTGSGCIAVSLLNELVLVRAVAIDLSASALRVADRNARRHNVRDRLTLIQADSLSAFNEQAAFSLIVANPPYVPAGAIESLPPEVRDHEPLAALVSGDDGLQHIRALLQATPQALHAKGHFIFEIGFGQSDAVGQLIDRADWRLVEVKKDLQGIPRTVVLQKR